MRKLLLILVLTTLLEPVFSQQMTQIAEDPPGDCYTPNTDALNMYYHLKSSEDSIFFILETLHDRTVDYGFVLAMDTDLITSNGAPLSQINLFASTPNTSMNYDLVAFVYENSLFPGVVAVTYDKDFNVSSNIIPSIQLLSSKKISIGFQFSQIAPFGKLNLIGGTGSFDIGPGGAGVWDVIPDNQYSSIPALDRPILSEPANQSMYHDFSNTQLSWYPIKGAESYQLEVGFDLEFISGLMPFNTTDTFYLLNNLQPLTEYYWKVKALKADLSSMWSSMWSTIYTFTTDEQNRINSLSSIECLKVYPNPSSGTWYIKKLPGCLPDRFMVRMIDASGKLVKDFGYVDKSGFNQINLPGLESGNYLLEFRLSRDKFLVKRLIME